MTKAELIYERLSPENRKELQKRLIGFLILLAMAVVMCIAFFMFIPNDTTVMVAMSIFWLFFFSVIGYLIRGPLVDLSKDQKLIVKGIVESRVSKVRRKSSSISRSVMIDGKKYYCDYHHWKDLRSGYRVELHYAKASNHTLKLLVLGVNLQKDLKTNPREYQRRKEPLEDYDQELNPEDKSLAKKSLRKWARYRLLVLLILAWPILGLSLSGLYAVLLFMFPLPIAFLVITFFLIRKFLRLSTDLNNGIKTVLGAQVLDKSITIRKAREYCNVTTTRGNLSVDKKMFDKIMTNESIQIVMLPKSRILIGLIDQNNSFNPVR